MSDPASLKQALSLLRTANFRPKRRLGQNFIFDHNILDRIADIAGLSFQDYVLEIGAGAGTLTHTLAKRAALVTAFEVDRKLEPILQQMLRPVTNVRLHWEDFIKAPLIEDLKEDGWPLEKEQAAGIVVSNLPYCITSPAIEKLLAMKSIFRRLVLLVQAEVAERITAEPNTPSYGSLSVFVQYHCQAKIVAKVSPGAFWPRPDVDSSLILLQPVHPGTTAVTDETLFFVVVRAAFGKRRKMLLNALANVRGPWNSDIIRRASEQAGISLDRRGETLSVAEFGRLSNAISESLALEAED
ncbi:MAG: 16S rRNA (adenine(1518)-N(6)/adenine(1519)-N(6))-dimethyltransferase RsmA [Armatimonadetes bacterium]|nr:16S rRNA (adenine(1518)-N(6)/adenine(1519)-N(6))-dimethyltransferase RsmA [Armatimonadota bacterium]